MDTIVRAGIFNVLGLEFRKGAIVHDQGILHVLC
jgi:hypothetical protein